jgi:hypothetical protein
MKKTSALNGITFTYDSTKWIVPKMTKADSIWVDSILNLKTNK